MIKSSAAPWTRQQTGFVLACTLSALVCKLLLAWFTFGTNDVLTWQVSAEREERGEFLDLYRNGNRFQLPDGRILPQVYNHPPTVFYALHMWRRLESMTGLPMRFWMRATDAFADLLSLAAIASLHVAGPGMLALIAISPVAILVSGFHGNTDPIVMLFLLLSIVAAERSKPLVAGICLAAACDVKLVAILLIPALVFHFPGRKQRILTVAAFTVSVLVSWAPYMLADPKAVLVSVFGYASVWGYWGIGSAGDSMLWRFPWSRPVVELYRHYGRYLIVLIAFGFGWRLRGRPLYFTAAFIFFAFLTLTPGFGVQYLSWLVPWLAVLPPAIGALEQIASGMFLVSVYNFWSGGLPWYYANSFQAGMWTSLPLRVLEYLAWLSVCLCLWVIGRTQTTESNPLGARDKMS